MTNTDVAEGLNKAREDAEAALMRQAESMGADAIVGMRFEIVEMGAGLFSASAMGTAVKTSAIAPAMPVMATTAKLPVMTPANDAGAVILPFRMRAAG